MKKRFSSIVILVVSILIGIVLIGLIFGVTISKITGKLIFRNPIAALLGLCEENWQCTEWSDCINYKQTRTCSDLNNCGTTENKPAEEKVCFPIDDIIKFIQGSWELGQGDIYVALSNSTRFTHVEKWHDWFSPTGEVPLIGDFNGDGKDDIATFTQGTTADVFVALSNGSKFLPAQKWSDWFSPAREIPGVGDFNGDGKDDIVTFTQGTAADVYVALSDGSKFLPAQKWHEWFSPTGEVPAVGDFDGDGLDDIVTFTQGTTAYVYVALSNGNEFITVGDPNKGYRWHNWFSPAGEVPRVGDFNGDGKDDIATFTQGTTAYVYVALSNGKDEFVNTRKWHNWFSPASEIPMVGDFNGDGKDDVITFTQGSAYLDQGDVYVALSNGKDEFVNTRKWHDWFSFSVDVPLVGDFDNYIPEACTENWQCTQWSACLDGQQIRKCTDLGNCGTAINKPTESKCCNGGECAESLVDFLDEMINFEQLYGKQIGKTKQFSSYDRTEGNMDFSNFLNGYIIYREDISPFPYWRERTDSCDTHECVLAEINHPGVIKRIWMTGTGFLGDRYNEGGVLRIYFDGEIDASISCKLADFFDGKCGPFVKPLVGNETEASGGYYSYFPIPFSKSIKISVYRPLGDFVYYHVTYQEFPDGYNIKTFSKNLNNNEKIVLNKVTQMWSGLNLGQYPYPEPGKTVSGQKNVIAYTDTEILNLNGHAVIKGIKLNINQNLDLSRVFIKIYWDNEENPSVYAPIDMFFGTGFGIHRYRALLTGITDWFYIYYPMPFFHNARIVIENQLGSDVTVGYNTIYEEKQLSDDTMKFHAKWKKENTQLGLNYNILSITGKGNYVGTIMNMGPLTNFDEIKKIDPVAVYAFLEGDETIYVDGETTPSIHGTGTEEFFLGAYYFVYDEFSLANNGLTFKRDGKIVAYRSNINDYIPFDSSIKIDIEHGSDNTWQAPYSSLAYYYLKEDKLYLKDSLVYYTDKNIGIESIRYQSSFDNYQAIDRDYPFYDYAPFVMIDNNVYKMYWCGRFQHNGCDGDHIGYATSLDGNTWTLQGYVVSPAWCTPENNPNRWYSGNSCDPEVIKVGNNYYMYVQVQIMNGERVNNNFFDICQNNQCDKIHLLTSINGINWQRKTDRHVIINVDDTTSNFHHQEVIYVPDIDPVMPYWLYVYAVINGEWLGYFRIKSAVPDTFDWNNAEPTNLAELGNQIGVAYDYDGNNNNLFFRITFYYDETKGRTIPTLQVSTNGLNWYWGNDEIKPVLEESYDNNRNKNVYFFALARNAGNSSIPKTGYDYVTHFYTTTSNSPGPDTDGDGIQDIFYSEIGEGDLKITITALDDEAPLYTDINQPSDLISGKILNFNSTWRDNVAIDDVLLEWQGTNYSYRAGQLTKTGNIYNKELILEAGIYSYRWHANDTTGNENMTEIITITIATKECINHEDCDSNQCSETYNDYCQGNRLVEYDNDKILDSTTIQESCDNICQVDNTCTSCSVDCSAPAINDYCVYGVCNADCEDNSDCLLDFICSSNCICLPIEFIGPIVDLIAPGNGTNTSQTIINFICTVDIIGNTILDNVTLYGNWNFWHANETKDIGYENLSYTTETFVKKLEYGTYIWNCLACDNSSNCEFSSENYTFTISKANPELNILFSPHWNVKPDTPTNVTCTANNQQVILNLYNETAQLSTGNSSIYYEFTPIEEGNYTFICNTTGNQNYTSDSVQETLIVSEIDTYPPDITLHEPENNSTWSVSNIVIFKYSVQDASNITKCSLIINNEIETKLNIKINKNETFEKQLPNAQYNWSINCTDEFNNIGNSLTWSFILSYTLPYQPPPSDGGGNGVYVPTTPTCTEDWRCSSWSECIEGKQTRTCWDRNLCNTTENKPVTEQACGILQAIELGREEKEVPFAEKIRIGIIIFISILILILGFILFMQLRKPRIPRKAIEEKPEPTGKPSLKEKYIAILKPYIDKAIRQGYSKEKIRKALELKGWPTDIIDELLSQF